MKITLIIAILIISGCSTTSKINPKQNTHNNATTVELETYCQNNDCRKNFRFKLNFKDGPVDKILPYYLPVIQHQNVISILPGEKHYIEADLTDKGLVNLKKVASLTTPEKTIKLSFKQNDTDNGMILHMSHPFSKVLKFDMYMLDLSNDEPHYTSSCPILPNKAIMEMWPYAIPQLYIVIREIYGEQETYTCD